MSVLTEIVNLFKAGNNPLQPKEDAQTVSQLVRIPPLEGHPKKRARINPTADRMSLEGKLEAHQEAQAWVAELEGEVQQKEHELREQASVQFSQAAIEQQLRTDLEAERSRSAKLTAESKLESVKHPAEASDFAQIDRLMHSTAWALACSYLQRLRCLAQDPGFKDTQLPQLRDFCTQGRCMPGTVSHRYKIGAHVEVYWRGDAQW